MGPDSADVFEAAKTYNRGREQNPIVLREHYSPACAVWLSVQVNLEQESTPVYHRANWAFYIRISQS
ncbi:MAG: hypothetical protein KUG81_03305 [Gammaproteobacteria bacterium]|nr:hypothetical protein [Gammaproteobacteria bacterium]